MILVGPAAVPAGPSTSTFALVVPPTPTPTPPAGRGAEFGKAAPTGLVVLLLFFLAVALLVRSMNKHLRRIPKSFEDKEKRE
jgi:H+/gluconate symporter-like permease